MSTQTLIFSLVISALITLLSTLAFYGEIIAIVLLTIVGTVVIFSSGGLLALSIVKTMQDKAQSDFYENAQENMGIMGQLQNVQSKQSKMLLDEITNINRLPVQKENTFEITEGIFDNI